jgi:hypothetical protein
MRPVSDPKDLLKDKPRHKKRELPEGIRLDAKGPGNSWIPCWMVDERRTKREWDTNGNRIIVDVYYRPVEGLLACFSGEIAKTIEIRVTTSLKATPIWDEKDGPFTDGIAGLVRQYGYDVTVVKGKTK